MSGVMRPVGPQPPSVYWVRRVLVLVVLLAIIGAVVWFVGRLGGSGGGDGAGPQVSSSPPASPSGSPTPSASPSVSKSPKPSKSATSSSSTPSKAVECKDDQIAVVASTDQDSYPVGGSPRLKMRISNSSDVACLRDVGSPANELIVNQGSSRFWSSDDCSPGGDSDIVTLQPGESYSVTLTWPEVRSEPGCPSSASPTGATPGDYTLVGRNGQVYSSPAKFKIT